MMKWSEITLPNEWLIENVTQPAKVTQDELLERSQFSQIFFQEF
jgi:hypothetical protein